MMVLATSFPSTSPACRIARDHFSKSPSDFGHQACASCSAPILQSGGQLFRKFTFNSLANAAGRGCGDAVTMMSSAPAQKPFVASKHGDGAESPSKKVHVIVKGRVQGVFYRNWTVDTAQQLGVNGWV
ncbi:unnamed protein product [Calypogeia fissa]